MALFKDFGMHSNYLGKLFYDTQRSRLDPGKINMFRRKIEDVKMSIIDAAENGKESIRLSDVTWLHDLQFDKNGYRFIFNEFDDWLSHNGLVADTGSSYDMVIRYNVYRNFDDVRLPDTTGWVDDMNEKWAKNKDTSRNSNRWDPINLLKNSRT